MTQHIIFSEVIPQEEEFANLTFDFHGEA